MAALSGRLAAVYCQTDDAATAFTAEATTEDATHLRYVITDATKRWVDPDTAVIVYADAVEVTSGYTIEYANGTIVFTEDPAAAITVTGAYLQVAQEGGCFNWSIDIQMDMQETTAFGDAWKTFMASLAGFTGSAEKYWGSEAFFDLLGVRVALELYVDTTTGSEKWYRGYGIIQKDGVTVAYDDVIKESIGFQGTMGLYFNQNVA
jgi:hypothetical protein